MLLTFPHLETAESFDTLEYKIGEIFSELQNKLQDGYTLRDVINEVDNLQFQSNEQKHELVFMKRRLRTWVMLVVTVVNITLTTIN